MVVNCYLLSILKNRNSVRVEIKLLLRYYPLADNSEQPHNLISKVTEHYANITIILVV